MMLIFLNIIPAFSQPRQSIQITKRSEPDIRILKYKIESEIHSAFGSKLGNVTVSLEDPNNLTFAGTFCIKQSKIIFPFKCDRKDRLYRIGPDRPLLWLNSRTFVHNEKIGGNDRFILLVRKFETDFPHQTTMSYWTQYPDGRWPVIGQRTSSFINKKIKGHKGPSVIVFDYNDYWSSHKANLIALYSWNDRTDAWDLLFRGIFP
jgi:hypothetical protein